VEQLSMTGSLFGKILGKKCVFTIWLTLNNNIDECSPMLFTVLDCYTFHMSSHLKNFQEGYPLIMTVKYIAI